jgi:hypothetical protein
LVFLLIAVMAVCAAGAGLLGYDLVAAGKASVAGGWDREITPTKWAVFSADAYAHVTSYLVGTAGGLYLIGQVLWRRWKESTNSVKGKKGANVRR